MLLPEGSRHREHPASLGISHPLPLSSVVSILHPWASVLQPCKCLASPGIHFCWLHTGEETRMGARIRGRGVRLRPPRLRAPQSKTQPVSGLLTYTVCQSQKTDWSVVAVGFPCSQSQPEMVCTDSRQHPFPKSHFPRCIPSLQCIHTPQQQDSISSECIQAL